MRAGGAQFTAVTPVHASASSELEVARTVTKLEEPRTIAKLQATYLADAARH